jgi:alkyl sulfatase BDS1-like metallo-beta-lactamase superfamily hydrolase
MKKKSFSFRKYFLITFSGFIILLAGYLIGRNDKSGVIEYQIGKLKEATTNSVAQIVGLDDRELLLMEHPQLISRIMKGGSFGNEETSIVAAKNMFSRLPEAIKDIKSKTEIEEVYADTWIVRMPIVNAVIVKTSEGLVIIDTGMSPAGPAIYAAARKVSDLPVHTIIYTHGHVDHSYATWAFIEAGESPQIIAHENILKRFNRYLKLRGSIAKNMSQPLEQLPASKSDIIWPTITFTDSLYLEVGNELFVLKHHKGETDDQLYVWMPERKVLASADYYQGFLPNAGNGKRIQRYVGDWAIALQEMAGLKPEILLPGHGNAIKGKEVILENLSILAETLLFIESHTIDGLNRGMRKDQIYQSVELPDRLKNHPSLRTLYVSEKDISKMVIRQFTGWWDDIPSNWSPSTIENQSKVITEMAGGVQNMIKLARSMMINDIAMAAHIADWAFFSEPGDEEVQKLVIEVYSKRIMNPESNTQEMLAYLDHMAMVRGMMKDKLDTEIKE